MVETGKAPHSPAASHRKRRKFLPPASPPGWRPFTALAGMLLLITGQILLFINPKSANPSTAAGIWLNDILHLGLHSVDTVLWGILVIALGALLISLALTSQGFDLAEDDPLPLHPLAFRMLGSMWVFILVAVIFYAALMTRLFSLANASAAFFWVASLFILLLIFLQWDHERGTSLTPAIERLDVILVLALLILGFLVATFRLQSWPDQIMPDEGVFGTTAADIAEGSFTPFIFAQGVDTFPILTTWYQALVMRIFGIDLWGWRFASVLPAVFTLLPFYLLLHQAFNRRLALLASLLLITNPYFLVYARLGYTNIQPVFLVTSTIWLLQAALKKDSLALFFMAGLTAGLGFYTYFSGRVAIVIALLLVLLFLLTRRISFRRALLAGGLLALGCTLVAAPHILYGSQQNSESMYFRIALSLFNNVTYASGFFPEGELTRFAPYLDLGNNSLFFHPGIYLVLILRGFLQTLLPFQKPGLLWGQHYLAVPLAGTLGACFFLLGLIVAFRFWKRPGFQLALLWFFAVILPLSVLNTSPPREDHLVPVVPALALITAFGVQAALGLLASLSGWVASHSRVLLIPLLLLLMASGLIGYFVTAPPAFPQNAENLMSWAGLASRGEALIYIYEDPLQADFIPWMMKRFRSDVDFRTIPVDQFEREIFTLEADRHCLVFYPPGLDPVITPLLRSAWGTDFIHQRFADRFGTPLLVVGMNFPFTFERQRSFLSVLPDAFRHAPFVILVSTLLLMLMLVVFAPVLKKHLTRTRYG